MLALTARATTTTTPATPALSTRAVAIEQAVAMRALHRRLAAEFESSVAPGHVLALAVRCARALQRGGCAPDLLAGTTERMVRAALVTRAS